MYQDPQEWNRIMKRDLLYQSTQAGLCTGEAKNPAAAEGLEGSQRTTGLQCT